IRLDVEEDDPVAVVEPAEHGIQEAVVEARTRRHAEPCQLQYLLRVLPGEEVDELVRADEEDGIVEALAAEQVDRARIRVQADVVVRKRGARELESNVR